MEPTRRDVLAAGAAATAMAAAPQVFAAPAAQGGRFYEKGKVRIRYDEAGSGFPLLLIAGGGLESRMAGLATSPFTPSARLKREYPRIYSAPRNANQGESPAP